MIRFRPKNFSVLTSTVQGAGLGLSTGTLVGGLAGRSNKEKLMWLGGATLAGAALGFIAGATKEIAHMNHNKDAGSRLLGKIVKKIALNGFKEGKDFTRDPKRANELRTKICMVMSSNGAEFNLLINIVDDKRLKELTKKVLEVMPSANIQKSTTASNRYNEIKIQTIPNPSSNIEMVVNMSSLYMKGGYPVYFTEVG